jgi:putative acyl-CoA dehydrogenase
MVGEEGRGVPTIIEMANHTRLDCVIGSAAWTRHAVAQALHHCAYRVAFGKPLVEQPLMQNVLADLAIESEAMTSAMMRLARSYDEAANDERQQLFKRLATAVLKYWICKRAPMVVGEALECLGGNGYVEESILPRLYREAPLSSIWEGSGNVMCLDVLRVIGRTPEALEAFFAEVGEARGADRRLDSFVERLRKDLGDFDAVETRARVLVQRMALALQASLLVRHSDPAVADGFVASRLDGDYGLAFGTLPRSVAFRKIVERSRPHLG